MDVRKDISIPMISDFDLPWWYYLPLLNLYVFLCQDWWRLHIHVGEQNVYRRGLCENAAISLWAPVSTAYYKAPSAESFQRPQFICFVWSTSQSKHCSWSVCNFFKPLLVFVPSPFLASFYNKKLHKLIVLLLIVVDFSFKFIIYCLASFNN